MQEEINVISHLLSVEKNAAVLIDNAVREADGRTTQARNQANSQFKEKYDKCVSQMEADYENKIQSRKNEHEQELEQFKADLQGRSKDYTAFNSLLKQLLNNKLV